MQEPTIFQVNFPLSQGTAGMFSMLPRSSSIEDVFQFKTNPSVTGYALPPDLFSEDDVLSSSPLLYSGGGSEEVSDSDLEQDLMRSTASSPTEELIKREVQIPPPAVFEKPSMEKFPLDKVSDFKHVIYNLLVDHHNNPDMVPFIEPVRIVLEGDIRTGFRFPENYNPEKKLPELYAQHIRRARLDLENQESIFIQDLYKFYLRAVLELLAKYFEKCDKYTFLDDDAPLFVPGTSLKEAEARMKTMRTRARKRKNANRESKKPVRKNKREW